MSHAAGMMLAGCIVYAIDLACCLHMQWACHGEADPPPGQGPMVMDIAFPVVASEIVGGQVGSLGRRDEHG